MKKKILIIGGTAFVGRVLLEHLLQLGGYEITLFNRGKTNAGLFSGVAQIHGNRETDDIKLLANKNWDVVIDFCGYYPLSLQKIVDTLRGRIGRYIFVSTGSVYDLEQIGEQTITEDSLLYTCSNDEKIDHSMETYGKRKVACEQVLLDAKADIDPIILRPGVIYGQYDPFDRHYYWLYRIQQQGKILVPTGSENLSSHTFVNDFAKIVTRAIDVPTHSNIYNTTTHPIISFSEMLDSMSRALNKKPTFVHADVEFQEEAEIEPWSDLPLWINGNFFMVDSSRVLNDFGLEMTPLDESFRLAAEYYASKQWYIPKSGMTLDEEKDYIKILLYS